MSDASGNGGNAEHPMVPISDGITSPIMAIISTEPAASVNHRGSNTPSTIRDPENPVLNGNDGQEEEDMDIDVVEPDVDEVSQCGIDRSAADEIDNVARVGPGSIFSNAKVNQHPIPSTSTDGIKVQDTTAAMGFKSIQFLNSTSSSNNFNGSSQTENVENNSAVIVGAAERVSSQEIAEGDDFGLEINIDSSSSSSDDHFSLLSREMISDESDEEEINIIDKVCATITAAHVAYCSLPVKSLQTTTEAGDKNTGKSRPERLKICAADGCKQQADFVCSECYKVAYCSEDHQLEHWKNDHEKSCARFSIRRSSAVLNAGPFIVDKHEKSVDKDVNYHMKAPRDIQTEEIILEEKPYLLSPWPRTRIRTNEISMLKGLAIRCLTCFGCCKYIGFNYTQCDACCLPLCSSNCTQVKSHLENECLIMKEVLMEKGPGMKFDIATLVKHEESQAMELLYTDVMIVRLILKLSNLGKQEGMKKQEDVWATLCRQWNIRLEQMLNKSRSGKKLHAEIEKHLPLSLFAAKGDKDIVWKMYCIVEENSFAFDLPFRRFRSLCTVLNQARHSCLPNGHAYLEDASGNHESEVEEIKIVLKAARNISEGNSITFLYCPAILTTLERRPRLMNSYLFWCKCPRCIDPTECGTHISSLVCPQCRTGRITPPASIVGASPQNDSGTVGGIIGGMKNVWTCDNLKCRRNPVNIAMNGGPSSATTSYLIKRSLELEQESLRFSGQLVNAMQFAASGPASRHLYKQHGVFLKQWDDILRGALFPLSDFTVERLSEFDVHMLEAVKDAKSKYEAIMKIINPVFNFEGFPLLTIEMMENEYYIRRDEVLLNQRDQILMRELAEMVDGSNESESSVATNNVLMARDIIGRRALRRGAPGPIEPGVSFRSMNV